MLQQLQEFLNECMSMGRRPRGLHYYKLHCTNITGIWFDYTDETYSYHDLFSIESGLMEFVEWKSKGDFVAYGELSVYDCREDYHYMMMGQMNANEKIIYFLENAKIKEE